MKMGVTMTSMNECQWKPRIQVQEIQRRWTCSVHINCDPLEKGPFFDMICASLRAFHPTFVLSTAKLYFS